MIIDALYFEETMWHLPMRWRVVLVVIGLITVLAGLAAWSFETEYGSGSNWAIESVDGISNLYAVDEQAPDAEGHPGTSLILRGTEAEVDAYIADYEAAGRTYTLPGLIVGSGVLLMIGGLFARRPEGTGQVSD